MCNILQSFVAEVEAFIIVDSGVKYSFSLVNLFIGCDCVSWRRLCCRVCVCVCVYVCVCVSVCLCVVETSSSCITHNDTVIITLL